MFQNLGTMLTNQNDIHDEIKSRLNSGSLLLFSPKILCLPISYQKT